MYWIIRQITVSLIQKNVIIVNVAVLVEQGIRGIDYFPKNFIFLSLYSLHFFFVELPFGLDYQDIKFHILDVISELWFNSWYYMVYLIPIGIEGFLLDFNIVYFFLSIWRRSQQQNRFWLSLFDEILNEGLKLIYLVTIQHIKSCETIMLVLKEVNIQIIVLDYSFISLGELVI